MAESFGFRCQLSDQDLPNRHQIVSLPLPFFVIPLRNSECFFVKQLVVATRRHFLKLFLTNLRVSFLQWDAQPVDEIALRPRLGPLAQFAPRATGDTDSMRIADFNNVCFYNSGSFQTPGFRKHIVYPNALKVKGFCDAARSDRTTSLYVEYGVGDADTKLRWHGQSVGEISARLLIFAFL